MATDTCTGETDGAYVGARDRKGARGLWESLPPEYRQCAAAFTDFRDSHAGIFPSERLRAVGKDTGKQVILKGLIILKCCPEIG